MDYEIRKVEEGNSEQGHCREYNYVKFTMLQIEDDYNDAIEILKCLRNEIKQD